MGILNETIDTELFPLGKFGMRAQIVDPHPSEMLIKFINNFNLLLKRINGLTWSMSSVLDIAKRCIPKQYDAFVKGIDVYGMSAGFDINYRLTLPEHYFCRAFTNKETLNFILVAPSIDLNCENVYYKGESEYHRTFYACHFIPIKKETLIDLTKNEQSTTTIGQILRGSYKWSPLSFDEANKILPGRSGLEMDD